MFCMYVGFDSLPTQKKYTTCKLRMLFLNFNLESGTVILLQCVFFELWDTYIQIGFGTTSINERQLAASDTIIIHILLETDASIYLSRLKYT